MRKIVFFMLFSLLFLSPINGQEISLERVFPNEANAGDEINVILIMNISGGTPSGIIVKDYIPNGWEVINQSSQGYYFTRNGSVVWIIYGDSVKGTVFEYSILAPKNASGKYVFEGEVVTLGGTFEAGGNKEILIKSVNLFKYILIILFILGIILVLFKKGFLKTIKEG